MSASRIIRHAACLSLVGALLCWPVSGQSEDVQPTDALRLAAAQPAPPPTQSGTISMDLADAGLEEVLKLLSQQADMSFIASEAVRSRRVTVYLDRVPVKTAIRSILDANNLSFRQVDGSNVYIVGASGGRPVKLITKVYTLKFARVVPTLGEASRTFGNTGSLLETTFDDDTSGSGSSGNSSGSNQGNTTTGQQGSGSSGNQTQGLVAIIQHLLTDRGSVTTDPRTNSLAVTDVEEVFPLVEETLARLDVKPAQVYLEAEVLEIKRSTLHRLGLEFGDSNGELATFTGPSRETNFPLGPQLLKRASTPTHTLGTLNLADLTATLKALRTESDVKFLASPRLMTLSNEVAEIRITTEAATGTSSTSQTDTGTVTTAVQRSTVGTVLRVTPLITDGKYVTMVIEPEVSRVVESTKFSTFLDPDRRAARATIMVEDGQTAMIAGLLSQDRENGDRKVPILGSIPLLGLAFTRQSRQLTDTEIVIFITPHLVPERSQKPMPVVPVPPKREQAPIQAKTSHEDRLHDPMRTRRTSW